MRPSSISSELLLACSALITAKFGLNFGGQGADDLERALNAAASELGGGGAERLIARLLDGTLSSRELDVLTDKLTVGETYFFRESDTLRVFEQHVLPELLRVRRAERRLRIWSAACSTGEEPYSIAIILDRAIAGRSAWDLRVLATDVNARSLSTARLGRYREWSFRTTPPGLRNQYFRRRADGLWELRDRIRSMVSFTCLNLASEDYGALGEGIDAIFCRNVLMYFEPERARRVAEKFQGALAPHGWLVVGAIDATIAALAPFGGSRPRHPTLYPRTQSGASHRLGVTIREHLFPEPPAVQPLATPSSAACSSCGGDPSPHARDERDPTAGQHTSRPPATDELPPRGSPSSWLPNTSGDAGRQADEGRRTCSAARPSGPEIATARRTVDGRRLAEAAEWCPKGVARDRMNPSHHYLLSAIQQEMGLVDAAAESLRRAIYLDRDFAIAHFSLANIELSRGRPSRAERHLSNTLAALQRFGREEVVPESDGLTAGRLAEIVTSLLAGVRGESNRSSGGPT